MTDTRLQRRRESLQVGWFGRSGFQETSIELRYWHQNMLRRQLPCKDQI